MYADAILDRLKNSSYIIELRGRSLRESTAVARKLKSVNKKETDDWRSSDCLLCRRQTRANYGGRGQ